MGYPAWVGQDGQWEERETQLIAENSQDIAFRIQPKESYHLYFQCDEY
jgi:hypothetical protein